MAKFVCNNQVVLHNIKMQKVYDNNDRQQANLDQKKPTLGFCSGELLILSPIKEETAYVEVIGSLN